MVTMARPLASRSAEASAIQSFSFEGLEGEGLRRSVLLRNAMLTSRSEPPTPENLVVSIQDYFDTRPRAENRQTPVDEEIDLDEEKWFDDLLCELEGAAPEDIPPTPFALSAEDDPASPVSENPALWTAFGEATAPKYHPEPEIKEEPQISCRSTGRVWDAESLDHPCLALADSVQDCKMNESFWTDGCSVSSEGSDSSSISSDDRSEEHVSAWGGVSPSQSLAVASAPLIEPEEWTAKWAQGLSSEAQAHFHDPFTTAYLHRHFTAGVIGVRQGGETPRQQVWQNYHGSLCGSSDLIVRSWQWCRPACSRPASQSLAPRD